MTKVQTVLITGATSGIGRAYADFYAKQQATLILVSRTESKLKKEKERLIKQYNVSVAYIVADLTQEYAAKAVFEQVTQLGLTVDVLINNAGVGYNGAVQEIDLERQHEEISLDILTVVDMCHLFVGPMIKKGTGTIVNLASTTAYYAVPQMATYGASKAFVLSFTEAFSAEVRSQGIRVLCVSPGPTDTNFFAPDRGIAYGQLRKAEDVVQTTIKGLKKKSASVIDGATNYVMSGIVPRLVSRNFVLRYVERTMEKLTANPE